MLEKRMNQTASARETLVTDFKNQLHETEENSRELQDFKDKYNDRLQTERTESTNANKDMKSTV
jgi:hypothetical protein